MTKKLLLRAVPQDVYQIILKEQLEQKLKCNCQFSIEQTIYKLIRKFKEEMPLPASLQGDNPLEKLCERAEFKAHMERIEKERSQLGKR